MARDGLLRKWLTGVSSPESMCLGKTGYLTAPSAWRSVTVHRRGQQRFQAKDGGSRNRLEAYRCRLCGQWHVGSTRTSDRTAGEFAQAFT